MNTRKTVMDRQTAEHFYDWMDRDVRIEDQHEVEQRIHALLRNHPDLLQTHTWPEMQSLSA